MDYHQRRAPLPRIYQIKFSILVSVEDHKGRQRYTNLSPSELQEAADYFITEIPIRYWGLEVSGHVNKSKQIITLKIQSAVPFDLDELYYFIETTPFDSPDMEGTIYEFY